MRVSREVAKDAKGRLALLAAALVCLTGCAMSRNIATVPHVDGSGTTTYRYIAAGGVFRPGVIVVTSQTVGSNAPQVLVQATGSALAPGFMGTPAAIAEAAILAKGLKESGDDKTTVVQGGAGGEGRGGASRPPPGHHSNRGR